MTWQLRRVSSEYHFFVAWPCWPGEGVHKALRGRHTSLHTPHSLMQTFYCAHSLMPSTVTCTAEVWAGLPNLHKLFLSENALTGQLPEAWGDLRGLTDLWVEYNQVRG